MSNSYKLLANLGIKKQGCFFYHITCWSSFNFYKNQQLLWRIMQIFFIDPTQSAVWRPPSCNFVKLNCDIALKKNNAFAVAAVVIRNRKGDLIDGVAVHLRASSPIAGAAMAMLRAIKLDCLWTSDGYPNPLSNSSHLRDGRKMANSQTSNSKAHRNS